MNARELVEVLLKLGWRIEFSRDKQSVRCELSLKDRSGDVMAFTASGKTIPESLDNVAWTMLAL